MSYSFSGPSSSDILAATTGAFCISLVYKIIEADAPSPFRILIIKEVADYVLFRLTTLFVKSSRGKAAFYAFTNLVVSVVALVAMRREKIIGLLGTVFFVSLMAVEFFCKVYDFSKYRS
jgi:hypothetical protein